MGLTKSSNDLLDEQENAAVLKIEGALARRARGLGRHTARRANGLGLGAELIAALQALAGAPPDDRATA